MGVLLLIISGADTPKRSIIGIVGAMDEEIDQILPNIKSASSHEHLGLTFTKGKLNGMKVVVAKSGIGKVNTAMVLTTLIEHYHPEAIIFTGIAGAIDDDLLPGDVVIGDRVTYHDMGYQYPSGFEDMQTINPMNGQKNPLVFHSDSLLVEYADRVLTDLDLQRPDDQRANIKQGLIVSGDLFVADKDKKEWLEQRYQADAVEMEGAAIGQICYQHSIPFLVIRSISDSADDSASVDFNEFISKAAKNSALLVEALLVVMKMNSY